MRRLSLILALVIALAGLGSVGLPARPAAAQDGLVWQAQFFNNDVLSGAPIFLTQYDSLRINWGEGSPAPVVNADYFSGRFTTNTFFEAGTYRFYILADDGVRMFVDLPTPFVPVIDTFGQPRPGETLTVDVELAGGYHHLQVELKELTHEAYIFVSWTRIAGPPQPTQPPAPPQTPAGQWRAEYYNNSNLIGHPVIVQFEASPNHNWGTNAPLPTISADFFSVRWSSVQNLNGGPYRLRVRADDGVRVYVDGSLRIDEWHGQMDAVYTDTFTLNAGPHTIVIEYYDATSFAYLEYSLEPVGAVQPPQLSGPTATVLAYRLNVRSRPSVTGSEIVAVINRGEIYPIIARSESGTWWQIQLDGTQGWVNGRYIAIDNEQPVPVEGAPTAPQQPGFTLTTRANLNIRSAPNLSATVVGLIPYSDTAEVIGRTADSAWWQVRYEGVAGWVSDFYVELGPNVTPDRIPVTG
ncbi:MAG: SH3 domain-containing protein [Chloroflexi bacterium]|nr:SH3 domain-containing protein [Chloroflexota bacterium]